MCFDRLAEDDAETKPFSELFSAELSCALRNGVTTAAIVLAVLVFQGTPAWILLVSVTGALALGTLLHQFVLLAGAGVLRAKVHWLETTDTPPT